MARKGHDLQKILVGGAAGAVIGGAATYAATHQKQTKKALSEIAKKTEEAVKRIDTEKAKELGEVALSRLKKTKTVKTAQKKLTNGNGIHKAAKRIPKVAKKKTVKRRKS